MISIIVCTYNREMYLGECLQHLADQDADVKDFEIVIVNNNSTDQTDAICQNFIRENNKLNINYLIEKQQGLTHARNAGIVHSRGELISFVDDDAFADKQFVKEVSSAFKDQSIQAVGGKIDPLYESGNPPAWMSHFLLPLVSALDMGSHQKPFKGSKFPIGANMSFRRSVFDALGVFDVNLGRKGAGGLEGGEEKEFFTRMKKKNMLIQYHPKVFVRHIIGDKRLQEDYIRSLGIGVGTSERKRVGKQGLLQKWLSEMIKLGGSLLLAFGYSLQFRFAAAWMLIKFRFWVAKGLSRK
jgi:glycosyltransferase involved in cell wall biosynthesis